MESAMRWTALLVFSSLLAAAEIGGSSVRTVYVMPMSHGLDQYVANQLTREHVFEVVADPKRADALFTDRLGDSLEYQLEKLNPTPKPPEPEAENKAEDKDAAAKDAGKDPDKDAESKGAESKGADSKGATQAAPRMMTDEGPPHTFVSGRDKGTLFLVDAKSRAVLWSLYAKPGRSAPNDLDRTAKHVVNRLKQDLAGK